MSLSVEAVAVAKKYTDNSIKGISGTLAGKNCTIKSIQKVNGVSTITFEWTADDGTVKTSTMNVMDGKDGKDGLNGKDGQQGADGSDGIGISKIEKISTVDLVDTYRITFTDNSTFDYEVTNGKDGQGGGTADVPIEKIKVNGVLQTPVNKVVDITVPDAYDDTALSNRVKTIEDDYAKSSDIPSLNGYATETWVNEQGFLTQHQDISNLVEKEDGKGLSSNDYTTEEKNKLAGLENYNDTALSNRVKSVEDEVPNLATKTYVGEQIANAEHLKREIVTVLPSDEEASDNIIYMLKVESTVGNDKYQEYMKIDGTVQMVGDTSVDLTDYAKTVDIPTTLPANGGNSDTVNNHTVESDVPTDAKFTDTVYDDTEVKKRISDNGYGEVAGGKNLLNHNIIDSKITNCSVLFKNDTFYATNKGSYSHFVLSVPTIVGKSYTVTIKDWSDYSYRCIASVSDLNDNTLVSMIITDATLSMTFTAVGTESLIQISPNNTPNEMSNTITFKCMLEEGSVATEYEPYFPSNKMLAEENEQQNTEAMDLKMLGWNVSEECPIQNYVDGNGVFHQRVGRVDLGTLDWSYSSDTTRFSTTEITDYKKKDSDSNTWVADAFLKGYSTVSGNDTASDSYDKSIGFNGINNMFFVRNTSYTDATSFKNAMQGQYLYYELATPITMTIDGHEAVTKVNESLSVIGKCKNLLNPTLQTTTINGITCTNNGDGTYTLNGTNSSDTNAEFILYGSSNLVELNKEFRLTGCPNNTYAYLFVGDWGIPWELYGKDTGNGINFKITTSSPDKRIAINVPKGVTVDNIVFKPMITTDLSATYDDFVPYTGDGDTLTHDVANLRGSLDKLVTYSTDEQIAGTYLDGKTIYRRSLEIQLDGELQKTLAFIEQGVTALEGGEDISIYINQITPAVNLSEWNIDTMVKVYGHITDYTDTTKTEKNVDLPYPVTYNSRAYVTGWYDYKSKLYTVRVGEQYANKNTAFLTFEYTKI